MLSISSDTRSSSRDLERENQLGSTSCEEWMKRYIGAFEKLLTQTLEFRYLIDDRSLEIQTVPMKGERALVLTDLALDSLKKGLKELGFEVFDEREAKSLHEKNPANLEKASSLFSLKIGVPEQPSPNALEEHSFQGIPNAWEVRAKLNEVIEKLADQKMAQMKEAFAKKDLQSYRIQLEPATVGKLQGKCCEKILSILQREGFKAFKDSAQFCIDVRPLQSPDAPSSFVDEFDKQEYLRAKDWWRSALQRPEFPKRQVLGVEAERNERQELNYLKDTAYGLNAVLHPSSFDRLKGELEERGFTIKVRSGEEFAKYRGLDTIYLLECRFPEEIKESDALESKEGLPSASELKKRWKATIDQAVLDLDASLKEGLESGNFRQLCKFFPAAKFGGCQKEILACLPELLAKRGILVEFDEKEEGVVCFATSMNSERTRLFEDNLDAREYPITMQWCLMPSSRKGSFVDINVYVAESLKDRSNVYLGGHFDQSPRLHATLSPHAFKKLERQLREKGLFFQCTEEGALGEGTVRRLRVGCDLRGGPLLPL